MNAETTTVGQKLANWMLDHRLTTLAMILLPTLLLAWALPSIEVYSRFADLLPAKHEYIKNYNRMKQTFGGANVVTMSLEVKGDQDVFTHETLTKVRMLTEQVDMIKGVNHYQVASIAHPKIRRIRTTAGGLIKSEPVLPRIIPKARAKLKGELSDCTMFCCGGDRNFFRRFDIHPVEFLRVVKRSKEEDQIIIDWVLSRKKESSLFVSLQ